MWMGTLHLECHIMYLSYVIATHVFYTYMCTWKAKERDKGKVGIGIDMTSECVCVVAPNLQFLWAELD